MDRFRLRFVSRYFFLVSLLFKLAAPTCFAQPLLSSKQRVNDLVVFRDLLQRNKFYYGPQKMQLKTDSDGKPQLQLLSIRYTGVQLTGDRGEKHFTNLLQFALVLPPTEAEELKRIREQLHLPLNAILQPLTLRNIDVVLVSGVLGGIGNTRLRKRAETQNESTTSDRGISWTERNFVLPLNNEEAQILWDQYESGMITVSVNYAFYAETVQIPEDRITVTGNGKGVKNLQEQIANLPPDTITSVELIDANAFDVNVDVQKFPGALKKIDINESSIPPAYPSLLVKCYDFELDTRPDLAFKRIFVQATSVNGQQVEEKVKFTSGKGAISTQYLGFKYAVRLDLPMRYKVLEYTFDGASHESAWIIMKPFANLIDATTTESKNPLLKRCIDVEILPDHMEKDSVDETSIYFTYFFANKPRISTVVFNKIKDRQFLKSICLAYEIEKPLQYFITRKYRNGRKEKAYPRPITEEDYLLIDH
jgi:hypothetical protein